MQRSLIAFLSGLLLVWSATGGDDESPQAIIKKAIKAHGGDANLAKTLRGKASTLLKVMRIGEEISATTVETFDIPNRYHQRVTDLSTESTFENAVIGEGGWLIRNGEEVKVGRFKKPTIEDRWHTRLATLPGYLDGKAKLDFAEKDKVNGENAVGVSVGNDHGQAIYFFDTKTGLLLKTRSSMPRPRSDGTLDYEVHFGDYKEVGGVQFPHRITSYAEGKQVAELIVTSIEFLDKVDDKLFEKPKR